MSPKDKNAIDWLIDWWLWPEYNFSTWSITVHGLTTIRLCQLRLYAVVTVCAWHKCAYWAYGVMHALLTDVLRFCSSRLGWWLITWPLLSAVCPSPVIWIDELMSWLIGWLIDWLTYWLIDWLIHWLIDWLTDWSIDRSIDWWIVCLIESLIESLNELWHDAYQVAYALHTPC